MTAVAATGVYVVVRPGFLVVSSGTLFNAGAVLNVTPAEADRLARAGLAERA